MCKRLGLLDFLHINYIVCRLTRHIGQFIWLSLMLTSPAAVPVLLTY
jgi:hypothetical protein